MWTSKTVKVDNGERKGWGEDPLIVRAGHDFALTQLSRRHLKHNICHLPEETLPYGATFPFFV